MTNHIETLREMRFRFPRAYFSLERAALDAAIAALAPAQSEAVSLTGAAPR